MPEIEVRPLATHDRAAWEPLWQGYQEFYHANLEPEQTDLSWARFHDPGEPMFALGAFVEGELRGIVHYIFHRSCWTPGPYCYLQDLFTAPAFRGIGLGRKLIEAVYAAAEEAGAGRATG